MIGEVRSLEDLYVDEQSQRPEWIGLGTGFFGTKRVPVPTAGASISEDRVTVPYSKVQVKDAPDIDSDVIDPETERALYAYYSRGGRAETDDLAETVKQEAVTRSDETISDEVIGEDSLEIILREERPVVEKETVAKERIGIEKDVEVDQETVEGKVRKERVEVEDDTKR